MLTWNRLNNDGLWMHSQFETEAECIKDATDNYEMKTGDSILIGTVNPYIVSVGAEDVLERLEEQAYDECGEAAESWNTFDTKINNEALDKLSEELTECVNRYLESVHEKPSFYHIEEIYKVMI